MTHQFTGAEFWNERFQHQEYMYGFDVNDFLKEQAYRIKQRGKVLNLAEGEGRNAVYLAEQGYQVCGVDFSVKGREKALKLAQERKVAIEYELADLTSYEMGVADWDAIVSIFCHMHENERPTLYRSIKQALKPGGLFIQEVYNRKQLAYGTGGPGDASHLSSLDELKEAFDGFEFIVAQDIDREIQEGAYHSGVSAVTQFIARKPME